MRFVWAVVAFVLAAVLIGSGLAQRTIFVGPSTQEMHVGIEEPAPFLLLDGDVLRSHPGAQTLRIRGEGEIFASYGRTADLEAWLAGSDHNSATIGADGELDVAHVAAETPADTEAESDVSDAEQPQTEGGTGDATAPSAGRSPVDSDLWLDSFTDEGTLIADDMQLPEGNSMLIARDGLADAPDDILVSWPLDNSTPWATPLMAAGGIMLLVGLILYVLGIRHQRRGRGPRRKGPGPLPVTEPIDIASLPPRERQVIASSTTGSADRGGRSQSDSRRAESPRMFPSTPRRRGRMLVLPALAMTTLFAIGCSPQTLPQGGGSSPTPSATPTVIAPENQKPPAVTEAQAKRILKKISTTVADADAALDLDLAATRLDGNALAARTTEYALRTALTDTPPPAIIPTDEVEVVLPEATDRWPRSVLLLSKSTSDDTLPPIILTMSQQDPWSDYKVQEMAEMSADAVFPDVAAAWLGTSLVPADSAFLRMPPEEIAAAFADVVDAGEQSQFRDLFDELALKLAASITDSRQVIVTKLAEKSADTSKATFDLTPSTSVPVSMTTLDSGAIVAVSLNDVQVVAPTVPDAVIRLGENPQEKALTGVSEAAKGVETVYGFQLFFSVPAQGSNEQIRLLAVRQDLLSAKVIK